MQKHNITLTLVLLGLLALFPIAIQAKFDNANASSNQSNKQESVVIGNVDKVTGNSFVVEDKKQNLKTDLVFDKNTKIIGQDKKITNMMQIKSSDKVAVISSDSAILKKAIRIYVKEATSTPQKRQAIQGVATAINGPVITLAHQIQSDRTYQILTTNLTSYKSKSQVASSSADITNFKVGARIIAIGDMNQSGQLVARMIHVIPGKAEGIFKKNPVSTGSSTLSPTPTVTSTPSATPTLPPSTSSAIINNP